MGFWDNLLKAGTTMASAVNNYGKLNNPTVNTTQAPANPLYTIPKTTPAPSLAPKTPGATFVGNGYDIPLANKIFGENARYVNILEHPEYKLSKGDYVLGGTGAEGMGALTDDVVNGIGATRLAGADRTATQGLVQGIYDKMYPNSVTPKGGDLITNPDGTKSVNPINIPLKSKDDLRAEGEALYNPQIANKKLGITNTLNSTLANLDLSKKSAQSRADKDIVDANQQTERAKANMFNNASAHGLSRSSIMDSDQGYATLANGVTLGGIKSGLSSTLAGIDSNINTAKTNADNEMTTLDNSLPDLVNQYVNGAWDSQYASLMGLGQLNRGIAGDNNNIIASNKSTKLAEDAQSFDQWYKTRVLDNQTAQTEASIAKGNATSSKTSSTASKEEVAANKKGIWKKFFDYQNDPSTLWDWINSDAVRDSIIDDTDETTYGKLREEAEKIFNGSLAKSTEIESSRVPKL